MHFDMQTYYHYQTNENLFSKKSSVSDSIDNAHTLFTAALAGKSMAFEHHMPSVEQQFKLFQSTTYDFPVTSYNSPSQYKIKICH